MSALVCSSWFSSAWRLKWHHNTVPMSARVCNSWFSSLRRLKWPNNTNDVTSYPIIPMTSQVTQQYSWRHKWPHNTNDVTSDPTILITSQVTPQYPDVTSDPTIPWSQPLLHAQLPLRNRFIPKKWMHYVSQGHHLRCNGSLNNLTFPAIYAPATSLRHNNIS